jgi:hypothetical protein
MPLLHLYSSLTDSWFPCVIPFLFPFFPISFFIHLAAPPVHGAAVAVLKLWRMSASSSVGGSMALFLIHSPIATTMKERGAGSVDLGHGGVVGSMAQVWKDEGRGDEAPPRPRSELQGGELMRRRAFCVWIRDLV